MRIARTYSSEEKYLSSAKRRRRAKKSGMKYIYLFITVFACAFLLMTNFVKTYSPDVDVAIGEKEEITLNDDNMNFEARPIDERLKWIQSEDELPATEQKTKKPQLMREAPKERPLNEIIAKQKNNATDTSVIEDFRAIPYAATVHEQSETKKSVVAKEEKPKTEFERIMEKERLKKEKVETVDIPLSITKVYVGSYATREEAAEAQAKISKDAEGVFVKSRNGKYMLQAGSFYDEAKADALVKELKDKGYSAKKVTDK